MRLIESYMADTPTGGGTQLICIRGSVGENFRQPKNIILASLQPKNISSFYTLTPETNMKYLEAMQIEVTNLNMCPASALSQLIPPKCNPLPKID